VKIITNSVNGAVMKILLTEEKAKYGGTAHRSKQA
jgi:hypothetical protein